MKPEDLRDSPSFRRRVLTDICRGAINRIFDYRGYCQVITQDAPQEGFIWREISFRCEREEYIIAALDAMAKDAELHKIRTFVKLPVTAFHDLAVEMEKNGISVRASCQIYPVIQLTLEFAGYP